CTLRDDVLKEVERLGKKGGSDQIVIESTGISEPVPVVHTISYYEDELGIVLTAICRLETMVTVVDANRFVHDCNSEYLLMDRELSVGES
ncbi:GTP-binding protein, partial [Staphylococcus aureus]